MNKEASTVFYKIRKSGVSPAAQRIIFFFCVSCGGVAISRADNAVSAYKPYKPASLRPIQISQPQFPIQDYPLSHATTFPIPLPYVRPNHGSWHNAPPHDGRDIALCQSGHYLPRDQRNSSNRHNSSNISGVATELT